MELHPVEKGRFVVKLNSDEVELGHIVLHHRPQVTHYFTHLLYASEVSDDVISVLSGRIGGGGSGGLGVGAD